MEMYKAYLNERENKELIYNDKGFAVYLINEKECYIQDIFIKPEFRKSFEASKLADEITKIAKDKGCTHLTGTVAPHLKSATDSLRVLLGYGMKLLSSDRDRIVFYKEIA